MTQRLLTLLEVALIIGAILFVMYIGGVFTPPPPPTPTPTAFTTSTPAPIQVPTAKPFFTQPPLTQATGRIAFTSDRDGDAEIYLMNADGTEQRNLTNNPAQDVLIGWSPDGTRLAFFSTRTGWLEIFVMEADGSHISQLTDSIDTGMAYSAPVSWSPDGKYLLGVRSIPWQAGQVAITMTLDLIQTDGARIIPVYTANNWLSSPKVSPDGRYLSVKQIDRSESRLYISPFSDHPNFSPINQPCTFDPAWQPIQNVITCSDGDSIFTISPDGAYHDSVSPHSNAGGYITSLSWSPDASSLLTNYFGFGGPSSQSLIFIRPDSGQHVMIYRDSAGMQTNTFAWAPDSQWLALTSTKNDLTDIYTLNIYAAQNSPAMIPLRLTGDSGNNYLPQWQPAQAH